MRVCTCFLLFGIFASTNSMPRFKPHPVPETVQKYTIDKHSGETKKLNNGHNFNAAITDRKKNLELVFKAPTVDSFTDFIQETVDILNIYEDAAFKEFFLILDKEIRNYHYKGCKVSELTENRDTKSFLTWTLKTIRGKPVAFTKAKINAVADMLRDETYDSSVKELLDYINSLYTNSKKKFYSVLSNFNNYRKTKSTTRNDLVQVVRNGVRTILFNHYTELDTHTRRELNKRIERFWEKCKSSLNSDAELNDIDADSVHEAVNRNYDISKNAMNEYRLTFKKDSQTNLKNKRERIISKETHDEHVQHKDIEEDVKSVESEEKTTDYTEELSSQQSFDSSSNSIKLSQERHEEYNTQRYVTLYTEEISYKARPTEKTEITGRHKPQRRPVTTPKYSFKNLGSARTNKVDILRMNRDQVDTKQDISPDLRHDSESGLMQESKHKPKARLPFDQPQGQSKPDQTRSKSRHKDAQIYSQYDAVIDVQLANADLLESLRMFAPGIGSQESEKYNKFLHQSSAVKRRAQTEVKPQNPTSPIKSPSRYSISNESHYKEQVNELRRSISAAPANIGPAELYMEDKNQKNKSSTRRSGNDTKVLDDYINKRISALENELKDLKQMRDIRSKAYKNNTDVAKLSNITNQRKDMAEYKIQRLSNTNHDLEIKDIIKENITKSYATNTETTINDNTYFKPNAISSDATNATVTKDTSTSQVTNSAVDITKTDTKDLNKEVTIATVTASKVDITNAMAAVSTVTAPSRETMVYAKPNYYDYPDRRIDPFEHMNDGLDLNM